MQKLTIPVAPMSIKKGSALKDILGAEAITQLGANFHSVWPAFNCANFSSQAMLGLDALSLKERSVHIATCMRSALPAVYSEAIDVMMSSLTDPLPETEGNGLAVIFYMPHGDFIGMYGQDPNGNAGVDPFDVSMHAQYELTQRATSEFSIRPFLADQPARTLEVLSLWMADENPHVRRLCSEGTRPRLPWGKKLIAFAGDPTLCLHILQHLKCDPDLYVRRSVANHLGDLAKDHLEWVLDLCESWLPGASVELKWLIRHALRNPAKKGVLRALDLRKLAK